MSGLASGPLGALAGVWLAWSGRAAWPAAAASRRADPLSTRAIRARLAASPLDVGCWLALSSPSAAVSTNRLANGIAKFGQNSGLRRGRQMLAGRGQLQHSKKSQTRPGAGWGSYLATSPREKRRDQLVCYYTSTC